MKGEILLGWFAPHPPLLIPGVGSGEEKQARATLGAMQAAAQAMVAARPEAIVVFGPHGPLFSDAFTIEQGTLLKGDLRRFGSDAGIEVEVQAELTKLIHQESSGRGLPIALLNDGLRRRFSLDPALDHGSTVPLFFLAKELGERLPPVVVVHMSGLPWEEHYALGVAIARAIRLSGLKVGVLASGDLSHKLSREAPAGYSPRAHLFDEVVVELLRSHSAESLGEAATLAEEAGECGFRPLAVYMGCFDSSRGNGCILSYEAPFGVGYLVSTHKPEHGSETVSRLPDLLRRRHEQLLKVRQAETPPVSLARQAVETYVREGRTLQEIPELPLTLPDQAGVFVSLKQNGVLRGCIGTTEPTRPTLGEEIVANAIAACSEDPRFDEVTVEELDELTYSVDILHAPHAVNDISELAPKQFGVMVKKGGRTGLLLPDLPGVETPEEQVAIAMQKAGLRRNESVQLYRFRVDRYH